MSRLSLLRLIAFSVILSIAQCGFVSGYWQTAENGSEESAEVLNARAIVAAANAVKGARVEMATAAKALEEAIKKVGRDEFVFKQAQKELREKEGAHRRLKKDAEKAVKEYIIAADAYFQDPDGPGLKDNAEAARVAKDAANTALVPAEAAVTAAKGARDSAQQALSSSNGAVTAAKEAFKSSREKLAKLTSKAGPATAPAMANAAAANSGPAEVRDNSAPRTGMARGRSFNARRDNKLLALDEQLTTKYGAAKKVSKALHTYRVYEDDLQFIEHAAEVIRIFNKAASSFDKIIVEDRNVTQIKTDIEKSLDELGKNFKIFRDELSENSLAKEAWRKFHVKYNVIYTAVESENPDDLDDPKNNALLMREVVKGITTELNEAQDFIDNYNTYQNYINQNGGTRGGSWRDDSSCWQLLFGF
ncbi:hypothetical protein Pan258_46110 [Symmachiella dynata]|uniref:hypothetical protein n=1 Tax=Symmachiella dynata TaxID=2527995 RepID=UPI00118B87BC|nr:hypothetical protein [Symmachiella dynata]QDT50532.1 hypothetical protein Pan258_46110 [Symmachiella dynata]